MHDERSTRLAASFGACRAQRRVAQPVRHGRSARRRLRPRQHASHPRRLRGPSGPRVSRVALPLTDEEKPIRLALWRATDRTFKQASEALTRVKTNVARRSRRRTRRPDFSREDPQTYTGDAGELLARHQSLGSAAAADLRALRRRPARVPQRRVAVGRRRQPLLHQQRRLAGRHAATWRAACSSRR